MKRPWESTFAYTGYAAFIAALSFLAVIYIEIDRLDKLKIEQLIGLFLFAIGAALAATITVFRNARSVPNLILCIVLFIGSIPLFSVLYLYIPFTIVFIVFILWIAVGR